tara:strand:- start:11 stop:2902 length:2892 start_codon:yes stop_codon:yes gene_type:complete
MSQTKAQLISDLVQALAFAATASAPTNGMFLSASNTLAISTNSTQRLTVDSSGNVGIGTSSPGTRLDIRTSSGEAFIKSSNGTVSNFFGVDSSNRGFIGTVTNHALLLSTNDAERMRISQGGNVGIGTSSPGAKLDVNGEASFSPNTAGKNTHTFTTNASNDGRYLIKSDTTTKVDIQANGTSFFNGGNVGIGTTSPASLLNISASSGGDTSGLRITRTDSGGGDWRIWSSATVNGEGAGKLIFANSGNRVAIDGSGNVGIGTMSPGERLHIAASSPALLIEATDTSTGESKLQLGKTGNTNVGEIKYSHSNNSLSFRVNDGEKARIDSSGNVGIGTTSPDTEVHVIGSLKLESTSGTGNAWTHYKNADQHYLVGVRGSSSDALAFYDLTADVERMRIDTSGNLLVGTTTAAGNMTVNMGTDKNISFNGNQGEVGDVPALVATNNAGSALESMGFRATDLRFATGSAERMRIDGSGNLLLNGGSDVRIELGTNGSAGTNDRNHVRGDGDNMKYNCNAGGGHIFEANGGERMRIHTDGNVGIGTTSPSSLLHLSGNQTALRIQRTSSLGFLYNVGTASTSATRLQAESGPLDLFTNASQPIIFKINGDNEKVRVHTNGNLGIGTTNPVRDFHNSNGVCLTTGAAPQYRLNGGAGDSNDNDRAIFGLATADDHFFSTAVAGDAVLRTTNSGNLLFGTGTTERMRLDSSGHIYIGRTTDSDSQGTTIRNDGFLRLNRDGQPCAVFNRNTNDGQIVQFRQGAVTEGDITVSGGTVNYNQFLGSHWAALTDWSRPEIKIGTILETINELTDWKYAAIEVEGEQKKICYNGTAAPGDTVSVEYEGEIYEGIVELETDPEFNKAVKVKVNDTAASKAVYGVFVAWNTDSDLDGGIWNDMYVGAVGNYVIRMAAGQDPEIGDLVESNGTGCGVVQDDDIIRTKTVAKITNTIPQVTYDDGSFLVTCVLYCG